MKIIGIDPGYGIVGVGVLYYERGRFQTLYAGAITTPTTLAFEYRLEMIHRELSEIIERFSPDQMAVEELFFSHNQTTGINVAQARGVILLAAAEHHIEPFEYTPMQVKQAVVGYGNAEKRQVIEMTTRILNLQARPKPDDVADALAVAICHAHSGALTSVRRATLKNHLRRTR